MGGWHSRYRMVFLLSILIHPVRFICGTVTLLRTLARIQQARTVSQPGVPDGQIAFLSTWNDEYDIFVWDGVSVANGSPDRSSFTNIAPDLTQYYGNPTWTNTGFLAFIATPPQERHTQIFVWDGQTAINISQNPGLHNGTPRWSNNGNWAFATFFSPQQLLYVRNAENDSLLTVEGSYSPAWSENGNLVFCQRRRLGWVLSLWDGQQIIELAEGYQIRAQWQSGSGVVCSSG